MVALTRRECALDELICGRGRRGRQMSFDNVVFRGQERFGLGSYNKGRRLKFYRPICNR